MAQQACFASKTSPPFTARQLRLTFFAILYARRQKVDHSFGGIRHRHVVTTANNNREDWLVGAPIALLICQRDWLRHS